MTFTLIRRQRRHLHRFFGALAVSFSLLLAAPSQAIMLNFEPATQSAYLNDTATVDIVISGLEQTPTPEYVGFFHLVVAYDTSLLFPNAVGFGNDLSAGQNNASWQFHNIDPNTGLLHLEQGSLLTDEAMLADYQNDSLTLASISFDTLSVGSSALNFEPYQFCIGSRCIDFGIDVKGWHGLILPVDTGYGAIDIKPRVAIPVISTLLLLLPGMLMLAMQSARTNDSNSKK